MTPDRTILLRGGIALTPDPSGFAYQVGETVAFVVTNDTDGDRVLAIESGDASGAMKGGDMTRDDGTMAESGDVTVQPGETATLIHEFSAPDTAVISWSSVSADEPVFRASLVTDSR